MIRTHSTRHNLLPSAPHRPYRSGSLHAHVQDAEVTLHVPDRGVTVTVAASGPSDRERIEQAVENAPRHRTMIRRAASTRCGILQLRDADNHPI